MRRVGRLAAVLLLLAAAVLPVPAQRADAASRPFAKTVVATRTHLVGGLNQEVDKRTVTLSVSETANLRGQQLVDVNWSGAHPTGFSSADPNWFSGQFAEYPMVLLECRGIDSPYVSAGQRLDPTTCWTEVPQERVQASGSGQVFQAWRLDRYAATDERKALVGVPKGACTGDVMKRIVPFVAADGTAYYEDGGFCGTLPPEGTRAPSQLNPPNNTTYAPTAVDGTGHARFEVWTSQENSSLGCSSTVPCSLVAVPIMGVSCDPAATALSAEDRPVDDPETEENEATEAQTDCEKTGSTEPGSQQTGEPSSARSDVSVTGALWWSASNWRNRITVPLSFASFGNVCDLLDSRTPVDFYGSELLTQATNQWAPAFCQDPELFKFRHVAVGEPLAKVGLAGGQFPAALISRPPDSGYPQPTVNAPVAVTGFAISYTVDDSHGREVTNLRLNARLLAKLLSESYLTLDGFKKDMGRPDDPNNPKNNVPAAYQAIAGNPLVLTEDPEFEALNPTVGDPDLPNAGAGTLLALSGNSDVIYALTQYINDDPEARAFLDGKPDPWGMRVNPGYLHMLLPAEAWPLLDYYVPSVAYASGQSFIDCLQDSVTKIVTPIPMLPMVSSPLTSLGLIAQKAEYAILNETITCNTLFDQDQNKVGGTFRAVGRQPPGKRFMIALTALPDGPRYGLREAALQTDAVVPNLSAKFTDDHGRHFVAPTDDSLRAAMALTTPDETTHTWPIPYQTLRTARGAGAYPGTMVVYAAIPTKGLDYPTAQHLSQFLQFAVSYGQRPGTGLGQLPPGYLPLTDANGLGALVLYTRRAAAAVAAQQGVVPTIADTPGTPAPTNAPTSPSPSASTTPNPGAPPSAAASSIAAYKPGVQLPVGYTAALGSRLAGLALPIVAAFGVLCLVLAAVVRSRAGALAVARLQARLQARLNRRLNSGNPR